ncbi:hypothetical protein ABEB36_010283 [Hypothenemus hampei]|uniref:Uncharacterized protein n=1 Tax=Hypothenemus hampei TaxID=57062 RepID=A0ABD1EJ57_HYPHA
MVPVMVLTSSVDSLTNTMNTASQNSKHQEKAMFDRETSIHNINLQCKVSQYVMCKRHFDLFVSHPFPVSSKADPRL